MLKKWAAAAVSAAFLLIGGLCGAQLQLTAELTVQAAETEEPAVLYFVPAVYKQYLAVPEELPQSLQLVPEGSYAEITYASDSSYLLVDENGTVTPGASLQASAAGSYTVTITADGEEFVHDVQLVDYAVYYAEQVTADYIAANITADMTGREKLVKICKFVAGYDYNAARTDMVSMIVTGEGGDCLAAADTVNYMCSLLGIESRARGASNDPGASATHRNNLVYIEEGMYIVDCGYTGTAPRTYRITLVSEEYVLFDYELLDDGTAELTEYFGTDPDFEIPETIDGYTVTSIGKKMFHNIDLYQGVVTSVTLPDTITNIGDYAFSGCKSLTELQLPASLETIGERAFYNCSSLTELQLPESMQTIGNRAFYACTGLQTLQLPEGMTAIGDGAFGKCTALTAVTIPDTVTSIGTGAFSSCTGLTDIVLPEQLTEVSDSLFEGCTALVSVTLPDGITSIGTAAFSGCTKLTGIALPDTVAVIGEQAFLECKALLVIVLPKSLVSLENACFQNCSVLRSVTFQEGLVSIGAKAFWGCGYLSGMELPTGLETIGDEAFAGSGLKAVNFPQSVTSIGAKVFLGCTNLQQINVEAGNAVYSSRNGVLFNSEQTVLLCYPTAKGQDIYIVPDTVTEIADRAFCSVSINGVDERPLLGTTSCAGLSEVILPEGLQRIGSYAFHKCQDLKTITLPASLSELGTAPFLECIGLKEIHVSPESTVFSSEGGVLFNRDKTALLCFPAGEYRDMYYVPSTVEVIADSAFRSCERLWNITIPASVTEIQVSVFTSSSVDNIYYTGSETEWNSIGVDDSANMAGIKIYYDSPYILPIGDVNVDESIDAMDATAVLMAAARAGAGQPCGLRTEQTEAADVNGDENYDAMDATKILQYAAAAGVGYKRTAEEFFAADLGWKITDGWGYYHYLDHIVIASYEGEATALQIPAEIHGLPVTEIADEAFRYHSELTSVIVPDTVEIIGERAFADCGITEIVIPDSVSVIGSAAFWKSDLTTIVIPESVTDMGTAVFRECQSLVSVTMLCDLDAIPEQTFRSCTALESVQLPASVRSIGRYVFYYCTSLTDVFFMGTETEWSAVTVEYGNTNLEEALMHYQGEAS